jgi:cupin 2 domain-containing protein
MMIRNLFTTIPDVLSEELLETLLESPHFRLERIVSAGHATPPGQWYDQDTDEWVILLSGSAGLRIEDEPSLLVLRPGDYVHIPAHRRHRVEETDPAGNTVWLALRYHRA